MSLPATYETFDLLPTEPVRAQRRAAVQSGAGGFLPQFSRRRTARTERSYVFPVLAGPAERRRLNDLWNRTRFGTLPMLLDHPEDGELAVVFDMPLLELAIDTAAASTVEVRLREWFG